MIRKYGGYSIHSTKRIIPSEVQKQLLTLLGITKTGIVEGLTLEKQENDIYLTQGMAFIGEYLILLQSDYKLNLSKKDLNQKLQIVLELDLEKDRIYVEVERLRPLRTNQVRLWLLHDFCIEHELCKPYQGSPWLWNGFSRSVVSKSEGLEFRELILRSSQITMPEGEFELYRNGLYLRRDADYTFSQNEIHLNSNEHLESDILNVNEFLGICTLGDSVQRRRHTSNMVLLLHPRKSIVNLVTLYSKSKTLIL